jgi:hypothetical protein
MNAEQLKRFQVNAEKHAAKLKRQAASELDARSRHVKQENKNGAGTSETH